MLLKLLLGVQELLGTRGAMELSLEIILSLMLTELGPADLRCHLFMCGNVSVLIKSVDI